MNKQSPPPIPNANESSTNRTITSRIMTALDANLAGNVHGGTILRMAEEACFIAVARFLASNSFERPVTSVLARLEHIDFIKPMMIGEVSILEAAVTFTSGGSSIETTCTVFAEDLSTGEKRKTNQCRFWFIAKDAISFENVKVPPLKLPQNVQELRENRYLLQKQRRSSFDFRERRKIAERAVRVQEEEISKTTSTLSKVTNENTTPSFSKTNLCTLITAMDCTGVDILSNHWNERKNSSPSSRPGGVDGRGILVGGVVMKLMDNAAGLCAFKHCKTNVVTACIDELDFKSPAFAGELLHVESIATFSSSRSLEIIVRVEAENLRTNYRRETCTGIFCFISLSQDTGRPQAIPALTPETFEEKVLFEEGRLRYEARKKERLKTRK
eukprot:g1874.t1